MAMPGPRACTDRAPSCAGIVPRSQDAGLSNKDPRSCRIPAHPVEEWPAYETAAHRSRSERAIQITRRITRRIDGCQVFQSLGMSSRCGYCDSVVAAALDPNQPIQGIRPRYHQLGPGSPESIAGSHRTWQSRPLRRARHRACGPVERFACPLRIDSDLCPAYKSISFPHFHPARAFAAAEASASSASK